LHGLWGDETNWTALGALHLTLDSAIAAGAQEMIVVMPDGDDSWYTTWNFLGDWPGCQRQTPPQRKNEAVADYCVPWPHYDDYIARDLVAHIDSAYRTLPDRNRRGIAGLSMGGYGAVWLALAYPDVFSAAASHSGILAPLLAEYDSTTQRARYASEVSEVVRLYGALSASMLLAFGKDTAGWWARDPGRRAIATVSRSPSRDPPKFYVDVGVNDRFLNQSRAFRDAVAGSQLLPEYHERPGGHDWTYWRRNAAHSLSFLARVLSQP
jgi:S-formylglutathione hydrolase FrmB